MMKPWVLAIAIATTGALSLVASTETDWSGKSAATHEHLWAFVINYLNDDVELSQMKALVDRAKTAGYTGLAIIPGKDYTSWTFNAEKDISSLAYRAANTGLEDLDHMRPDRLARFQELKRHCDARGFDFVPLVWSTGYCSMQYADTAYASAWALKDVPYVARGGTAVFVPEPYEVDFSNHTRVVDCAAREKATVTTKLQVKPCRKYRVSLEMKTSCMQHSPDPGSRGPVVGIWSERFAKGQQFETHCCPHLPPSTGDYRPIVFTFITDEADTEVTLHTRAGDSDKEGTVAFRNLRVEEMGLELPIRRATTPLVVRDAATGRVYREGVDYAAVAPITSLRTQPGAGCPNLELTLLPGGAIADGTRLLLSDYEPKDIYGEQFGTCLTNPELFAYYRKSAADLQRALGLKSWFLSADEIRVGCHCEGCRASADTDGVKIGRNYAAQCAAIRAVCPDAEIYMWPDMADINHNAMDGYALMNDTTIGALPFVPTNVTMVCWWGSKSDVIPTYFAARGYRTMGAGFYDKKTAAETRKSAAEWMKSLNDVPGARGLMYTSWDYGTGLNMAFLEDYADVFKTMSKPYAPTDATALPRAMMSYNIRAGRGNGPGMGAMKEDDPEAYLREVAAVITREKPDWVAIQEADNYAKRSFRQNQMRILSERTGLFPIFGQAIRHRGGQGEGAYGVGLLSREKPLGYRVVPLPDVGEDRVLLICEFAGYTVAVTHFSLNGKAAAEMARTVVRELGASKKPVFLAGDFNSTPESEAIAELKKGFVALSDNTRPTYPTNPEIPEKPVSIDWIFVDRAHADACRTARGRILDDAVGSDHFPIRCDR